MASARVAAFSSWPRTALVTVLEPGLRTPRMVMHRCSHSITTITPRGCEDPLQRVGDLGGQPLLDLRPLGVEVDQPGQLAQPGDPAVGAGDVADVGDAGERHQVVLAAAPDLDVLDQHELVVAEVEGRGQHLLGLLPQPGEHLRVRPRHPLRGVLQPVAVGVLADTDQDLPDGGHDPGVVERTGHRSPEAAAVTDKSGPLIGSQGSRVAVATGVSRRRREARAAARPGWPGGSGSATGRHSAAGRCAVCPCGSCPLTVAAAVLAVDRPAAAG